MHLFAAALNGPGFGHFFKFKKTGWVVFRRPQKRGFSMTISPGIAALLERAADQINSTKDRKDDAKN